MFLQDSNTKYKSLSWTREMLVSFYKCIFAAVSLFCRVSVFCVQHVFFEALICLCDSSHSQKISETSNSKSDTLESVLISEIV